MGPPPRQNATKCYGCPTAHIRVPLGRGLADRLQPVGSGEVVVGHPDPVPTVNGVCLVLLEGERRAQPTECVIVDGIQPFVNLLGRDGSALPRCPA